MEQIVDWRPRPAIARSGHWVHGLESTGETRRSRPRADARGAAAADDPSVDSERRRSLVGHSIRSAAPAWGGPARTNWTAREETAEDPSRLRSRSGHQEHVPSDTVEDGAIF